MGRSNKKATPTKKKEIDAHQEDDEPDTVTDKEHTAKNENMLSPRELRRRHRESLRAKATGKIDMNAASQQPANRRIVFDNEGEDDDQNPNGEAEIEAGISENRYSDGIEEQLRQESEDDKVVAGAQDDGDSDDDDAIEEVQTSKAREKEKQKRSEERDSARASLQTQAKKRKRNTLTKNKRESTEVDTEEFDDEFFNQLEQEKQIAKEEQRVAKKLERQSKGKHTTFVVNKGEDIVSLPTETRGMEVAVISQDTELLMPEPNEKEVYLKDCLESGSDGLSAKQIQKAKKKRKKAVEAPSWHRSTKMNRLVAPGSGRQSRGKPASLFVKKK